MEKDFEESWRLGTLLTAAVVLAGLVIGVPQALSGLGAGARLFALAAFATSVGLLLAAALTPAPTTNRLAMVAGGFFLTLTGLAILSFPGGAPAGLTGKMKLDYGDGERISTVCGQVTGEQNGYFRVEAEVYVIVPKKYVDGKPVPDSIDRVWVPTRLVRSLTAVDNCS